MKKNTDMRWFRSKVPTGETCRFGFIGESNGDTLLLELCIDVNSGEEPPIVSDSLRLEAHDGSRWDLAGLRRVRTPTYPDGSSVVCVQVFALTKAS